MLGDWLNDRWWRLCWVVRQGVVRADWWKWWDRVSCVLIGGNGETPCRVWPRFSGDETGVRAQQVGAAGDHHHFKIVFPRVKMSRQSQFDSQFLFKSIQMQSHITINIHAPTPLYIVSISYKYFPRVTWSNIFPVALLIPPSLQLLICLCWDWYDLSRLLSCSHLSHFEGITLILYLPLITFPCFAHQ